MLEGAHKIWKRPDIYICLGVMFHGKRKVQLEVRSEKLEMVVAAHKLYSAADYILNLLRFT